MSKTIREIIDNVDELKPNALSGEIKTRWISTLEGRLQTEVMLMGFEEVLTYRWPDDRETQVLVEPPYDDIYEKYLAAMIDYANGEYNKYENAMAMFNETLSAFTCWFAWRYEPANGYPDEEGTV